MLQIKPYTPAQKTVPEWHIGDSVPELHGVVRMVVDGHELQMILAAMQHCHGVDRHGSLVFGYDICEG